MKDTTAKRQRELGKWKRELERPPYRGYGVMLVIMVALVHLLDEYASSSSGAIQSSVINELFVQNMHMDYAAGLSMLSLVSLLSMVAALAATFYKSLADRYGRRIFFVLSALGMGVGMLICAVSENAAMYFLGRTIIGFFTATDFQVMYIMEVAPDNKRGIFYSVTKSLGTLGIVLIAVVRGMFMNVDTGNWRMVYLVPAIAGIGLAVLAMVFSRETKVFMERRIEKLENELSGSQTKQAPKKSGNLRQAFKLSFQHRQLRMQLIASVLFMGAMMPFTGYYESIMVAGGMTAQQVTTALFFYPISWAILLFVSGFISDKKGRKFATILFGVIAVVALIGYILGAENGMSPVLVGLLLGAAIGSYWTSSNTISLMTVEVAPTVLRASVQAVFGIVVLVGTLAFTAVYAALVAFIPLKPLCIGGGAICLAVSLLFVALTTQETAGRKLDSEMESVAKK